MDAHNDIESDCSFDHLSLREVASPTETSEIISSTSIADWDRISQVKQFPGSITKRVNPSDFAYYQMAIETHVEPGARVDLHMHEEPVFQYVVRGEVTLHGVKYGPGGWVLFPERTPYKVGTPSGYSVLANYGAKCGSPQDLAVKPP